MFTWRLGPLGCSVPGSGDLELEASARGRESPCGKHLAQVIVTLGRLTEKRGRTGGRKLRSWVRGWGGSLRKAAQPLHGDTACFHTPCRTPPSPPPADWDKAECGAWWGLIPHPILSWALTDCPWAVRCLGILGLGTKMCPLVHHPVLGGHVHT